MSGKAKADPNELLGCLIAGLVCGVALGAAAEERRRRMDKHTLDIAQIKRDIAKLREGAAE